MNRTPQAVIVGAGIIGLSIGWQLARRQWPVHIYEQRLAGKQASWSSAGMLAPYSEAVFQNEGLFNICESSMTLYPRYLQELEEDTQCAIPEEKQGTLCVAIDRDDRRWLQRIFEFKKNHGMPVYWISGTEAREREPLLSPKVNSAIWIPSERQVHSQLLLELLKKAFLQKGGHLFENQHKIDYEPAENEVVINASGAWANERVYPVKGQILSLKMTPELHLSCMIRSPRIYLAPKHDDSVKVGATSEEKGFDESCTAGAALELLQNAWEVIPAVSEYQLKEMQAGLRPSTMDHLPIIRRSEKKSCYHAIGHGRAGIMLAPFTVYQLMQILKEDFPHANLL